MNANIDTSVICPHCKVWTHHEHTASECIKNLNKHEAQLKEELLATRAKLRELQGEKVA